MKSFVTCVPLGRMGNSLYSAAAALAYAYDHDLRFTMPHETPNKFWKALYLQHLVDPEFKAMEPSKLRRIELKECGYPFHPLEFKPEWAEDCLIVVDGYRQSPKYWQHHRDRVLDAFGFPRRGMSGLWTAVHVRRSDALKYPTKHLIQSKEWIEAQMEKFPGHQFRFFSDDYPWCRENFGHRSDCHFDEFPRVMAVDDERPEVQDLVDASCCSHLIGSSSTFAIWIGLLQRNSNARRIFPKQWLVEGWEGTTAETWADIMPREWERA